MLQNFLFPIGGDKNGNAHNVNTFPAGAKKIIPRRVYAFYSPNEL